MTPSGSELLVDHLEVGRPQRGPRRGVRRRVTRAVGAWAGTLLVLVVGAFAVVGGWGRGTRDDLADEAEALARGGLSVLSYDGRNASAWGLSRDDGQLAADALAGLDAVAHLAGVDPDRVGLRTSRRG
jgi:hypothetical protein